VFCQNCGAQNREDATTCNACGVTLSKVGGLASGAPQINNYLIPAIFSTLCCCLPFGIVSIVYAAQVNGKIAAGDIAGANQSANNAKMWFWIAFGFGLVISVISFAVNFFAAISAMPQGPR
jgi:hypothetical protein